MGSSYASPTVVDGRYATKVYDDDKPAAFNAPLDGSYASIAIGGAPVFSPAALFASGNVKGWWRDASDLASQWQDVARTVPAAVDMPVGFVWDKSGNDNHWQSSAGNRPILRKSGSLYFWETVGNGDGFLGLGTSIFTAAMDLFYAITPNGAETLWVTVISTSAGSYGGVAVANNAGAIDQNVGVPSYYVDRAAVARDRSALQALIPVNSTHLLEARGADLSGGVWAEDRWANYPGAPFGGRLFGTIGVPIAVGDANRAAIETWLAARGGVAL